MPGYSAKLVALTVTIQYNKIEVMFQITKKAGRFYDRKKQLWPAACC